MPDDLELLKQIKGKEDTANREIAEEEKKLKKEYEEFTKSKEAEVEEERKRLEKKYQKAVEKERNKLASEAEARMKAAEEKAMKLSLVLDQQQVAEIVAKLIKKHVEK